MLFRLAVVALCWGVVLRDAGAEPRPIEAAPPAAVVLPAFTETGHVIVQAYLNGSGPFWCLLDTGNSNTTIFRSVSEALGLEVEPFGEMIGLGPDTLPVGKATGVRVELRAGDSSAGIDEPLVSVLPEEARLPAFAGRSIDAILGGTLLERFVARIDYLKKTIELHEPGTYRPPADAPAIRIELTDGYPHVAGSVSALIDGSASEPIEGEFLIDLGSSVALDVKRSRLGALVDLDGPIAGRRIVGQISGIDGQALDLEAIPAARVRMGDVPFEIGEIMVLPIDGGGPAIGNLVGTLGGAAFRETGITLHYPSRTIYLD